MIEWIHLKNFQNHSDTRIDFVLGLNVISGSSDQGKSAILRALNWVAFNRPSGKDIIKNDATKCTVTVKCSDAPPVSRVRGPKDNYYMIGTKKLKAMGTAVPPEVTAALGISEVNIANQFEEYFLLQNTPGDVAKYLNRITNLDIIDMVFLETKRRTMKVKAVIEDTEIQIKANQEALKEYAHLDDIEELVTQLEEATNERGRLIGRKNKLKDILDTIAEINSRTAEIDTIINMHKECSDIMADITAIEGDILNKRRLETILDDIKSKKDEISEVTLWLKIEDDKKGLDEAISELSTLKSNRLSLSRIVKSIRNRMDKIKNEDKSLSLLTNQLDTLKSEIDVCPICGRGMNDIKRHKNRHG